VFILQIINPVNSQYSVPIKLMEDGVLGTHGVIAPELVVRVSGKFNHFTKIVKIRLFWMYEITIPSKFSRFTPVSSEVTL
jgi:hypothetical protein